MKTSRNAHDKQKLKDPVIAKYLALLGRSLRMAREHQKLTQEQLASAMLKKGFGIHQSNISRFEKGLEDPCYTTLVGFANALDIPLGKLVEYGEYIRGLEHRREERRAA